MTLRDLALEAIGRIQERQRIERVASGPSDDNNVPPNLDEDEGLNLTDVLQMSDDRTEQDHRGSSLARTAETHFDALSHARALKQYACDTPERKVIDAICGRLNESVCDTRGKLLALNQPLPEKVTGIGDVLATLDASPRVQLDEAREVADALGLAIYPWDYMVRNAQSGGGLQAKAFSEGVRPWFVPNVMAPIGMYDLQQHVDCEDDLPIYGAQSMAQALLAISMALPVLRMLVANQKDLDERVRRTERRVDKVESEMANLKSRMDQLERQVKETQRQAMIRAARDEAMRQELSRLRSVVPDDPIMIAVPAKADVTAPGVIGIVGPCWGPDFPAAVAKALELRRIAGQRKRFEQLAKTWRTLGADAVFR